MPVIQDNGWTISSGPSGYTEVTMPYGHMMGQGNSSYLGVTGKAANILIHLQKLKAPSTIQDEISKLSHDEPVVIYAHGPGEPSDITKQHERIHVGQELAGYTPDPATIAKIVQQSPKINFMSSKAFEVPAYAFQDPKNISQPAFNTMMADQYQNNPQRSFYQTANLPENAVRSSMRTMGPSADMRQMLVQKILEMMYSQGIK